MTPTATEVQLCRDILKSLRNRRDPRVESMEIVTAIVERAWLLAQVSEELRGPITVEMGRIRNENTN